GDVSDVEEVVDQSPEMRDLVAHGPPGTNREVLLALDAIEDAHGADDDREGVAQLVTEHGEELVLGPAGALRLGPRRLLTRKQILAISLDPPALLDERGGRQDHDGHRAHEALQQEGRLVWCGAGEGSGAPQHPPYAASRP